MRVSIGSLNHGHGVCGAQAAETGRKARAPLLTCFIDLKKAYGNADRISSLALEYHRRDSSHPTTPGWDQSFCAA